MARNRSSFPLTSGADGFVFPTNMGNARSNIDVVHEMIGGNERLADWADKNPGEFYTKLYARTIVKQIEADHTVSETLEQKLARLEAGDRAINITPTSIDGVPLAPAPAMREAVETYADDDGDDDDGDAR